MFRKFTLAIFALGLCASCVFAADWPRFLGPNGNGMASDTGINKDWTKKAPAVLWKIPLSDNGYAGPAVADGKVIIIDHQGTQDIVRALDLRTGTDVWKYPYADNEKMNGGSYGYATSTPAIDQGKVYTVSRLGVVNCLDLKTGALSLDA